MLGFQNVAVACFHGVATLTSFSSKKMFGRVAGARQVGRNDSKVGLHCYWD